MILAKQKSDHTNERITADNHQIKVVSSVKLLGLQLDDKLNINLHIRRRQVNFLLYGQLGELIWVGQWAK